MVNVPFTKMAGAGNDFILIDNRDFKVEENISAFVRAISKRRVSVGADGVILLETSTKAEFRMMYYNADGSYGGMCGNGGRCVARFAHLIGISKTEMNFEALDQIYTAKVMSDGDVKLHMPKPQTLKLNFKLSAETAQGKDIVNACYADTGSPHVVIFTHDLGNAREMVDIDSIDVLAMGRSIRYHREFAPGGTNVNFAQMLPNGVVKIRTYERGVEDETLGCGTGAVACALITNSINNASPPIRVLTRSGEYLTVGFRVESGHVCDLYLEGSAKVIYRGELHYDAARLAIVG